MKSLLGRTKPSTRHKRPEVGHSWFTVSFNLVLLLFCLYKHQKGAN